MFKRSKRLVVLLVTLFAIAVIGVGATYYLKSKNYFATEAIGSHRPTASPRPSSSPPSEVSVLVKGNVYDQNGNAVVAATITATTPGITIKDETPVTTDSTGFFQKYVLVKPPVQEYTFTATKSMGQCHTLRGSADYAVSSTGSNIVRIIGKISNICNPSASPSR